MFSYQHQCRGLSPQLRCALWSALACAVLPARAQTPPPVRPLFIQEYRVLGANLLGPEDIENAVYPFLGPERTPEDVEKARGALEKAYHDKGYQTVQVMIPEQQVKRGVVILEAVENKVGRLRVRGSRYFDIEKIKAKVPSLAEGKVPNFNDVSREVLALNQWPDRQVSPALKPGVEPGTVDIDLTVKDKLPLHGNVELNNRYSADTKPLRVNASVSYDNLWQRGHSVGASFQVSPQDPDQVKVFSGYYLARVPGVDWLSIMAQGVKQNSNVSTLGAVAVAGRGETVGVRALIALPPRKDYYHSASVGIDYKHFEQQVGLGATTTGGTASAASTITTPITYYPLSFGYNGTWVGKNYATDLNASLNLHLRGMGSNPREFDNNRYNADGNFIYFRGGLSHTQKLPGRFELFGKVHGQLADQPLVSSEQLGAGGLGTVRGYLEAEVLGDSGGFGTIELRGPSMLGWTGRKDTEWQLYVFGEGGLVRIHDPLLDQTAEYRLASIGVGSRVRLYDYLNGTVDLSLPLSTLPRTKAYDPFLSFRVWADF